MIRVQFLLEEIKNETIKLNVISKLPLIQKEIDNLLVQIRICINIETANTYFNILQSIQDIVAELVFNYEIKVSSSLRKFVRDCDRLDDPWLREYLFNQIKNNQYSL